MRHELGIGESRPARVMLVLLAAALVGVLLLTPLLVLFVEAARAGFDAFMDALTDPDAASAIRLTLLVAAIVVPLNTVFGVAAAWCLSRYRFSGRAVLVTLLALPFTISPVVTGLTGASTHWPPCRTWRKMETLMPSARSWRPRM